MFAAEQIRYARLRHAEFLRGLHLSPALSRNQLAQRYDQFGAQRQYCDLVGRDPRSTNTLPDDLMILDFISMQSPVSPYSQFEIGSRRTLRFLAEGVQYINRFGKLGDVQHAPI